MKLPRFFAPAVLLFRKNRLAFSLVALAALVLVFALVRAARPAKDIASYYAVKRGDFLISIVEGGTLEAVKEEVIRSEVEGTARIIFIVPEGSYVKKGDLLVELDSSASQDTVNQQQINVEKAQFAVIQSEQQLAIQQSTVDSEVDAANLKVEFAQSDLDKFVRGERQQQLRNAQIEITNVLETLQIAEERLQWTDQLTGKGYETKANLDKDRLTVSQTKLKLEQAKKAYEILADFDVPKKQRELEAALQEAKENLERVKLQGQSKLAQFKADVDTQKSTLELSKRKLERDLKQLQATKVFAPQDGLVVYPSGSGRFSSESMIEEGAVVRNRQELIKLPDISEMKLQVKIHESHINQVRLGQPAYVVLDAMPDRRFQGTVNRVAPLPDSQSRWGNPNLKVYATEILIRDRLPDVKPGVSARAEVIITNLSQVLTVPIQAVSTRKGRQVVFLSHAPQRPVPVSIGLYNLRFIEVTSGLKEGDLVLLAPPYDTEEKDLAGGIVQNGETVPAAETNYPPALQETRAPRSTDAPALAGASLGERPRGNREPGLDDSSSGNPDERRREPRVSRGEGVDGPGRSVRPGEEGRGGESARMNREAFMKQFDTNGDGQLDETERAALEAQRAALRERFGGRRRGGSNTPPAGVMEPNATR